MNCSIKIRTIIILLIGSILSITSCKKATLPAVTTAGVIDITQTSAYSGGQVTSDGNAKVTARGVCWNTSENPTITNSKTSDSTGTGLFTSHLTQLAPNTFYYVKAYATNSEGTVYGNQVTFTTDEVAIATLTTTGLKSVSLTSAGSGGEISNDGGVPVTERGVCWNTSGSPTISDSHSSDGTGSGFFSSTLTELTISTTYYVKAYAINSIGTGYGNELSFTQMEPVADNDGNIYSIVTIGPQVWMGENLKTKTYNDGITIPIVSSGIEWANMSTPAYCWYSNNEQTYKATYGALYNWYAVSTGKLCPAGWHVPTDAEYTTLITYLGGDKIAGGKLKEAGTAHWATPNTGATNGTSFSALPGGGRYNLYSEGGAFSDIGYYNYLWSATENTSGNAWSRDISYILNNVKKAEYSKKDGGSVRCIRNN